MSDVKLARERIAVIGTGNFGIAIAKRLLDYDYNVVFGSRNPNHAYLKECLYDVDDQQLSVGSIGEAFEKADRVVFLAIGANDAIYLNFVKEIKRSISENKNKYQNKTRIIIELSNSSDLQVSMAEKLNDLIQQNIKFLSIDIVKGFNLLSAYSISNDSIEIKGSSERVPIAGDNLESKEYVARVCAKIGYQAFDVGPLKNALKLEMQNNKTFEDWYYPFLISSMFVLFNFVWVFLIYFYFPKKPHTFAQYLNDFSLLGHTNKVLGFSALQILAFVYFGSIVAGLFQLAFGTKYKRFPKWLDNWLKTRKQFGLLAFLIASFHVIASLLVANPSYLADWYKKLEKPNKFNLTVMTLNGEINMITGFFSYIVMALVALSSVNSIANSLNWSEWRFVQSKLGILCLCSALLHGIAMYLRIYFEKDEFNYSFVYLITRVKLIALYFPSLVVILRFLFSYFPPIASKLDTIRNGSNEKLNGHLSETHLKKK